MSNQEQEAERYAVAMMLVGAAFAKDGDGQKVRQLMMPELLKGYSIGKAIKAIQSNDRQGVQRFLESIGVVMGPRESAIDALLRTHMTQSQMELEDMLRSVNNVMERYKTVDASEEKTDAKTS
jgi:hypothetical protein